MRGLLENTFVTNTLINVALAVYVYLMSEHLTQFIRPTVLSYLESKLPVLSGDRKEQVASLIMVSSDFCSTIGAILTAGVALLFEVWKIRDNFHAFAEYLYFGVLVVMPFIVYRLLKVDWLVADEHEYKQRVGARLKWTARVMALLLALFPLGERLVELYAQQPAGKDCRLLEQDWDPATSSLLHTIPNGLVVTIVADWPMA